ncbi:hypothetical protein IWX76_001311 [Pedobacter sp. CAN_A7]
MRSDYIKINEATDHYQHCLNFTSNESSVAVYLNGLRLFLDEDYVISDRMITLNVTVESNSRIIVSHS